MLKMTFVQSDLQVCSCYPESKSSNQSDIDNYEVVRSFHTEVIFNLCTRQIPNYHNILKNNMVSMRNNYHAFIFEQI